MTAYFLSEFEIIVLSNQNQKSGFKLKTKFVLKRGFAVQKLEIFAH